MKLSLQKMKALVSSGALDEGIYNSIAAQVKNNLIVDTTQISEQAIKELAEELGTEHPETRATDSEVASQQNVFDVAARIRSWFVWKNGRRLQAISFNRDRIIDQYEQALAAVATPGASAESRAEGHA